MYLTDTHTGVTYCRVVVRSLDTPVNMSLCTSSPSNGPLGTGVYSVEVYDIESDGGVLSVPALAGEMVTVYGPSTAYGSSPVYSKPIRATSIDGTNNTIQNCLLATTILFASKAVL